VNGPDREGLFGVIYIGAKTGRILHAMLTYGNSGPEKRYNGTAAIRATLAAWRSTQHAARPARHPAGSFPARHARDVPASSPPDRAAMTRAGRNHATAITGARPNLAGTKFLPG
jgi:hypothetical protein